MENRNRPIFKRVVAGLAAITLLALVVSITNSFTGNPVSAKLAEKEISNYIKEKYSNMNLKLSKASYNFKNSGYTLTASSTESSDTHFNVTKTRGGRIYDDYESYVLGGYNTFDRFGKETTKLIEPLLKKEFGDELSGRLFVDCFADKKEVKGIYPLDMPYSKDLKLNATVFIDFTMKNPDVEDLANKLQKVDKLLKQEGFSIGGYIGDVKSAGSKKGYFYQVKADKINDKLNENLKTALDKGTYDSDVSISVMK